MTATEEDNTRELALCKYSQDAYRVAAGRGRPGLTRGALIAREGNAEADAQT